MDQAWRRKIGDLGSGDLYEDGEGDIDQWLRLTFGLQHHLLTGVENASAEVVITEARRDHQKCSAFADYVL